MSTSSLYEPDSDDEASDSDTRNSPEKHAFISSSLSFTRSQRFSSPELNEEDDHVPLSRTLQTRNSRLRTIRRNGLTKVSAEAYRKVLNETIDEISSGLLQLDHTHANTQHGIVTWTSKEKETFFNVLTRKGKNGIREIATAIETKSELEVQDYLRILHKGLEVQQLRERHSRSATLADHPAAVELGDALCLALDKYSELLLLLEREAELRSGKQKHGDLWFIDSKTAETVEERLGTENPPLPQTSVALSARLFNIRKWVYLSERFFMNSGGSRAEDNWINVAYKDETPAITVDAFADFYAIAVSLTRRIVHSTLFFAMSRLRIMSHQKVRKVKTADVKAALDVLKLKHDCFDIWKSLPRRLNLEVADIRNKKGWKADYLEYDEVEAALSERQRSCLQSSSYHHSEADDGNADDEDDDGSVNDDAEDEYAEDMESIQLSDQQSLGSLSSSDLVMLNEESEEDQEDIFANYVDQQASWHEELRIRESLKCPILESLPPVVKEEEGNITPPTVERKNQEDLVDWRDRTHYRSDWEEYGDTLIDINKDLVENRRKRRRIEMSKPLPRLSSRRELGFTRQHIDDDDKSIDPQTSDRESNEDLCDYRLPDTEDAGMIRVKRNSHNEIGLGGNAYRAGDISYKRDDVSQSQYGTSDHDMPSHHKEDDTSHHSICSSADQRDISDDGG